jgi:hypothetical protein
MKTITSELFIAAPVATVWTLTVNVEAWPRITPDTMTSVELLQGGPLALGSSARIKQPGQRAKVWTVTEFDEQRRFAWSAKSRGLTMTGRHELVEADNGVRNVLTIELSGRLAGLVAAVAGRTIRRTITTENECFKAAAEG